MEKEQLAITAAADVSDTGHVQSTGESGEDMYLSDPSSLEDQSDGREDETSLWSKYKKNPAHETVKIKGRDNEILVWSRTVKAVQVTFSVCKKQTEQQALDISSSSWKVIVNSCHWNLKHSEQTSGSEPFTLHLCLLHNYN